MRPHLLGSPAPSAEAIVHGQGGACTVDGKALPQAAKSASPSAKSAASGDVRMHRQQGDSKLDFRCEQLALLGASKEAVLSACLAEGCAHVAEIAQLPKKGFGMLPPLAPADDDEGAASTHD